MGAALVVPYPRRDWGCVPTTRAILLFSTDKRSHEHGTLAPSLRHPARIPPHPTAGPDPLPPTNPHIPH
jgi:hypothetical protein